MAGRFFVGAKETPARAGAPAGFHARAVKTVRQAAGRDVGGQSPGGVRSDLRGPTEGSLGGLLSPRDDLPRGWGVSPAEAVRLASGGLTHPAPLAT
jgi:hypothetical protein